MKSLFPRALETLFILRVVLRTGLLPEDALCSGLRFLLRCAGT